MSSDSDDIYEDDLGVVTENKAKAKKAPRFKVLLHNDDYKRWNLLFLFLKKYFLNRKKNKRHYAYVHEKGVGVCGVFVLKLQKLK